MWLSRVSAATCFVSTVMTWWMPQCLVTKHDSSTTPASPTVTPKSSLVMEIRRSWYSLSESKLLTIHCVPILPYSWLFSRHKIFEAFEDWSRHENLVLRKLVLLLYTLECFVSIKYNYVNFVLVHFVKLTSVIKVIQSLPCSFYYTVA